MRVTDRVDPEAGNARQRRPGHRIHTAAGRGGGGREVRLVDVGGFEELRFRTADFEIALPNLGQVVGVLGLDGRHRVLGGGGLEGDTPAEVGVQLPERHPGQ